MAEKSECENEFFHSVLIKEFLDVTGKKFDGNGK